MKKIIKFLVMALVVAVAAIGTAGCNAKLKEGKAYNLFAYDVSSDKFVKLGASIAFGKDLKTYSYVFSDGSLTIRGNVQHVDKPDMYVFSCSDDVNTVVKEKYREYLLESNADESIMELFNVMSDAFTTKMQLMQYNGYLFDMSAVELYHSPKEANAGSFEGEFVMTQNGERLVFRGNTAYTADDDGVFTVPAGYYSAANGILTFTAIDENGNDKYENGVLYRKRYLMATISMPKDFDFIGTNFEEQMEEAEFVKEIKSEMADFSGKTVAVLADEFFAYDIK